MTDVTRRRIPEIDVVRGFALAGLPLVNLMLTVGENRYPDPDAFSAFVYHDLVYQRFLSIFCFLFGVSFALILRSASGRAERPRLVLARRLVVLLAIGIVQLLVLDGNLQLAVYAVLGLVVLLPLSYLPRHVQLVVGLALLAASMPIVEPDPEHAGNPLKVLAEWSGLLAIGASTVRYGIHADLARRGRQLRTALLVSVTLAVISNLLRLDPANVLGSVLAEIRLLSTSATYVVALLLLLRTRAVTALSAVFAPLGRMALTCFLTQAAAAMVFAALVDVRGWNYAAVTFGCTTAFVVAQAAVCAWWLRRYRYGPVEWLWRCATWLDVVPMRRTDLVR
ncbi:DUF418 domain-containing protein [Amycolatopsis cihanbeyliensis]|uniref:Putative membrane protein YeiB n=1 Tax=Amycolatopsis cihanbeyliensis TaxID=1128664 RepID=A0A542DNG9_AMYCI|nr:DUF418 domain-containing protein [Amycolatopsis cihanbeyliensis]TQJ04636.1 putative membrane protein YeiB [Amycolatopsis cihanbeyliensis]